ncbi:hypothetical protein SDC9_85835 [bioreactor metagenome]|uniref:Uncharacterized protein n=1 Tax=bioreactor metagenome TaxID=1076179 RepID=A0A644ZE96_9ZZZZ
MIRSVKFLSGLFKVQRQKEDDVAIAVKMETPKDECCPESKLIEVVAKPVARPHRQIGKDESLAFCDDCHKWTPMKWLPIGERGKTAETWFECEYCGGRKLTLKYLSQKEAVRLNEQRKQG